LKTVFMFPGQGAQQAGMGKALAEAHAKIQALYEQANAIVGYDLARLCFAGPQEKLNETVISQPAIFVTSAACLHALRAGQAAPELAGVEPDWCAGLSLGEYTALYAAGAMSFEAGLKLVQLRGESMQAAADSRAGTMVSLLGADEQQVAALCAAVLAEGIQEADGGAAILAGVNYNCPGQIVVSGTLKACERAAARAEEFGASRAIPLAVAGGFHTKMMDPAAARLRQALDETVFTMPRYATAANVDAKLYGSVREIPEKLMQQLVSPVRWQQSVEFLLHAGAERFVEIGPGRVLTGLVKKIARDAGKKVEIITVNG